MVRDVTLAPQDLIFPVFVTHGRQQKREICSMPGQFQWSIDRLEEIGAAVVEAGIPAVILFGIPETKDAQGSGAWQSDGVIQLAIEKLKACFPELLTIADACFCEYTNHGHCGLLYDPRHNEAHEGLPSQYLLNDESLVLLQKIAVSQATAGADLIAPSGMLDGMVQAIRLALDQACFQHVGIMSYSVKYASACYGPFRDAAAGAPAFGDRKTHQMDPANRKGPLTEAELDIQEGADFLIVKPALAYLDVISQVRQKFVDMPLVAYNVSGEYAMVKAAAEKGWIDERAIVRELLIGMKRAGVDSIITYHALDMCQWLKG
jgi:porphobilinogen synthase